MRLINAEERAALQALIEACEAAKAPYEDAVVALNREIARVKRACLAPSDAVLDDCSFEWVKLEQTQQGPKRVPIFTQNDEP